MKKLIKLGFFSLSTALLLVACGDTGVGDPEDPATEEPGDPDEGTEEDLIDDDFDEELEEDLDDDGQ